MLFNLLILFFVALLAGLSTFLIPGIKDKKYKLVLVFAGAYLFAVTIIHILPELFSRAENPTKIGLFILVGFFLQQVLEYFTSGVEHGHVHKHNEGHEHKASSAILVLFGLSVHAFLEGSLLAHPSALHEHHESNSLLFGILLHKAPAAFALMSILMCQVKKRNLAVLFLVLFSLASPLGLLIGDYYVENNMLSNEAFTILFAIVSGNFLHISTTIVFESSVDHHFNAKKLGVGILGSLVAVSAEYFF
ncbi:ZIP family metal transporter [Fulvivirga ulvae]|uniref:ZIP family metal transporter n=1 Tax=Fulvivirga ulvae TaxID=2904245 RepID=UPI001F1B96EC|nr:ZIP family metal transporter [Fulvivirga ulvae]UII34340.1 ZIP family metal transporter [Fulvivirga ulvae]